MKTKNIKTPRITKKQTMILLYLLKFRFLTTNQLRQLLKHKNSNRTLEWIQDLIQKDCIRIYKRPNTFIDKSQPNIYYLGPKARRIIAKERELELEDLEYIYSEKARKERFIIHCLSIADVYLFMLSQQTNEEDIEFFTSFELGSYEYFPDPLPDAFIAIQTKDTTHYYFLDVFEEFIPAFVPREKIRQYITYAENSDWEENTNDAPYPKVLFICSSNDLKTHIQIYGKTQLDKTYEDKVEMFVTTKTLIKHAEHDNIWSKIS